MSYITDLSGAITITPALTWQELKRRPHLRSLRLLLDEERTDTDEGYAARVTASVVTAHYEDGGKGRTYNGAGPLGDLQSLLGAYGETHEFTGCITCEGEDPGDLWRLTVRGGRVAREEARIVWPGDSAEGGGH
ncbi:DUF6205 family protein [Actinomadura litoris]|uniref:DUF6205 family protein n=1 Tax=Actinomadura litoris TaxID=2678616 RepID=UPI001FA770A5|nr:DUF6205 family protein [Actinomadura litoris]